MVLSTASKWTLHTRCKLPPHAPPLFLYTFPERRKEKKKSEEKRNDEGKEKRGAYKKSELQSMQYSLTHSRQYEATESYSSWKSHETKRHENWLNPFWIAAFHSVHFQVAFDF